MQQERDEYQLDGQGDAWHELSSNIDAKIGEAGGGLCRAGYLQGSGEILPPARKLSIQMDSCRLVRRNLPEVVWRCLLRTAMEGTVDD
ncbi:MAG TPA: hypothetical protein DIT89_12575 [Planctomycetaceae bacterium]|nr:hypothetical protein [Planctomycetaceae bacterium]